MPSAVRITEINCTLFEAGLVFFFPQHESLITGEANGQRPEPSVQQA